MKSENNLASEAESGRSLAQAVEPSPEDRLDEIRREIDALPPGPMRIRLRLLYERHQGCRTPKRRTSLNWIKALTPLIATVAAAWTLTAGITEFRRATEDREAAPFLAALAQLSDSTSESSRASALITIAEYAGKPNFYSHRSDDDLSRAERVAMLLGLALAHERSPSLRLLYVNFIDQNDTLLASGLSILLSENAGLRTVVAPLDTADRGTALRQRLSALGIADILAHRDGPRREVATMLNAGAFDFPEPLSLNLAGVHLHGVTFGGLDLRGSDFSGDTLEDVDFSKAELDSASVSTICRAQLVSVQLPARYDCLNGEANRNQGVTEALPNAQ